MPGPGWSGQNPGQEQMQQMQDRMMQGWAWQQERNRAGQQAPYDRLGCLARMLRGLLTLVFGLAWIALLVVAGWVLIDGDPVLAGVVAVGALIVMFMATRISKWGRS